MSPSRDVSILCSKAIALHKMGKFTEAVDCIDKAIELDPLSTILWGNKLLFLFPLERYQEVIECCDRMLKIDPDLVEIWNEKGLALASLGRYKEAVECYDRFLRVESKNAGAWINKAKALTHLKLYKEADKCYDQALHLDKNIVDSWNGKASVVIALDGDPKEVLRYCDMALKIDQRSAVAWHNKAFAHYKSIQLEEMCECANKAIKLDEEIAPKWKELLELPDVPILLVYSKHDGSITAISQESCKGESTGAKAIASFEKIVEPTVASLIEALKDEQTHFGAIAALQNIGEPAINPLIKALGNENKEIRIGANAALQIIGEPAVTPLVKEYVKASHHGNSKELATIVYPLCEIGEPAIKVLREMTDSSDNDIREAAHSIISIIGKFKFKNTQ